MYNLLLRLRGPLASNFAAAISALFFAAFALFAVFGQWLAPHEPLETNVSARLQGPFWAEDGTMTYPLGTDELGRDVLSRIISGTRVSFTIGLSGLVIGGLAGTALGFAAGYAGGLFRSVVLRAADVAFGFPTILLGLLLAISLGPGYWTVVIVLGLVLWSRFARLMATEVNAIMTRDYIQLARVAGCSHSRMLRAHVLPNVLHTLVVYSTLQLGWGVLTESSLSFLGAGIPPPDPSWGSMVAAGRDYLRTAWWLSVFPSLALVVLVISLNILGDWLRTKTDPTVV